MKNKIILIALLFGIFTISFGQDSTFRRGYLRVRSQGNAFSRLAADSVMHIPLKTSLSLNDVDLSPQVFVMDSILYYTVGTTYKVASSGTGSTFDGHYGSLIGAPTIPTPDWNATSGVNVILNKPALFNGAYSSLTGAPAIPAAQIASDWNASSGITAIANKPVIPTIAAGTNTSVTYSGGVYTINSTGSGSGGSYTAPTTYTFTSTGSSTITLPYAYVSGSVSVSENGVPQVNSFSQTSSTVITLNYVPFTGTTFVITYTKQ